MTQTEALKLALEALELTARDYREQRQAITAIREALAQPEQEPQKQDWKTPPKEDAPLVKWAKEQTPTHRKPLSNQKIIEMYNEPRSDAEMIEFARAIEAAHGIKGEA